MLTALPSLRVAIVGSGPAGLYAAAHLLSADGLTAEVHVFDRLATPWGLVRAGVAPDHAKIKSVTRVYERTAESPAFRFHGNVEVGTDVSHAELAAAYHAVIYAFGAATDRQLGIPGEELLGSHAATEFVAWYNGHPDHAERKFDLSARRVVVVGNGNVALDVARILALSVDRLRKTDIADYAIEALERSEVEEIVVLGRRGPAQAAYTNPELRELAELADADLVVRPADVELDRASREFLGSDAASATAKRNVQILTECSQRPPRDRRRRIVLRFCLSPVEIVGADRVEGIRVVRNELIADSDGRISARPTDASELIECQLVLRSIGYRSTPLPDVPFDDQSGTIHNRCGRVTQAGTENPLPGVYAAGWVKRGSSGVIGTNRRCAQETVDLLLEDLHAGRLPTPSSDPDALLELLEQRGVKVVDYAGWERLDAYERALGEPEDRPRVKLVRRSDHLRVARPDSGTGRAQSATLAECPARTPRR